MAKEKVKEKEECTKAKEKDTRAKECPREKEKERAKVSKGRKEKE